MVDKALGLGFQISILWKILRINGKRTYPLPSSHGSPQKMVSTETAILLLGAACGREIKAITAIISLPSFQLFLPVYLVIDRVVVPVFQLVVVVAVVVLLMMTVVVLLILLLLMVAMMTKITICQELASLSPL